jgi:hypothetical protein
MKYSRANALVDGAFAAVLGWNVWRVTTPHDGALALAISAGMFVWIVLMRSGSIHAVVSQ